MEMPDFTNSVLYILMRSDLESLTGTSTNRLAGKAAAQATHAANQCVYEIRRSGDPFLHGQLVAWEGDRGFGTCIVLSATGREINTIIQQMSVFGIHCGITHDPSYPLRDGDFVHLIPLDTCAFAFGFKEQLAPFLDTLSLMI